MITDYASLQQAIIDQTHRSDLTPHLPGIIQLVEAHIRRALPLRVTSETVTGTSTDGQIPTPANFAGVEHIKAGKKRLEYRDVFQEDMTHPSAYSVRGDEIWMDAGGDYELHYTAMLPALSDSNTTNSLLLDQPDIYLWGAMQEIGKFTHDADMASRYSVMFIGALDQTARQDERRRLPREGVLQIKPRCAV